MIDLHCDTLSLLQETGEGLKQNKFCVDLGKLKTVNAKAEFFACFVDIKNYENTDMAYEYVCSLIDFGKNEFFKNKNTVYLAKNYKDYIKNTENNKISAFLTVEEGGIIGNDINKIDMLYEKGIRLITLCWNYENSIGFPNSRDKEIMQNGLKPFGFEVIKRLNEKGIIIDLSHLSDGGFFDVISNTDKPLIASHSNARALCRHPRNLTDEMITALAEKGGVAGVNFYPFFLKKDGNAEIYDIAEHILYMFNVGGEDFVSIGTDFDGFQGTVKGISNIADIERLFSVLKAKGLTERQLEKIKYKNAERIIKDIFT